MDTTHSSSRSALARAASLGLLSAPLLLAPLNLGASPRDHVIAWMPPGGGDDGYRLHVGRWAAVRRSSCAAETSRRTRPAHPRKKRTSPARSEAQPSEVK